eukprot:3115262-Pyramimonas_sp.AAC.1
MLGGSFNGYACNTDDLCCARANSGWAKRIIKGRAMSAETAKRYEACFPKCTHRSAKNPDCDSETLSAAA